VCRFHHLRSWTRFRRCQVRRVPFTCFALPDSISGVPSVSGPVFRFCAPGLIFDGTEGVRSRFRRYRGRRVPFSCFKLPNSFSEVPRASGPVFMFSMPGIIFDGIEGIGSRFHILLARTRFRQCRGRRVPYSRYASPEFFSVVPRASCPVFMFSAPRLIFDGTEGAGYRFHVLRS
jgi:hypothetical protein